MIRTARTAIFAATAAILALAAAPAPADTFPEHAVNIVSPFPAGGSTDVLARILAEDMSRTLKQPLVIVNKAGAATTIGASYASREKPDGYTMLVATNSTLVTSRFLFKDLRFDPDSFEPVGMIGYGPFVLLGTKKRDFKSPDDIVAYARAHPGELSVASQGTGTVSHLIAECFKRVAGIEMIHVPFKGSSQALPILINGDVDVFFDTAGTGMLQARAGNVDVFAVTTKERMSWLPDVPTLREQGYPDCEIAAWWSFVAPEGTPKPALATLRSALQSALKNETVRKKMLEMGIEPSDGTAKTVVDQMHSEIPVFGDLVKQANIPAQ